MEPEKTAVPYLKFRNPRGGKFKVNGSNESNKKPTTNTA